SAVEGTHTSTITHTAASADPIYDNFNANNVTATITDNDRFAFVANRTSGNISIYNVDPSTGALSPDPGSTFLIDAAPGSFAVAAHPSGEFLYVANADNDTVSALAIDSSTGGLSLIEAEIAAANAQPFSVAVDRTGSFLYVANIGDGTVSAYSINQSTGELTPIGNPVASGTQARFVAPHPTADFLYVANEGDNNFSGFIINPGGSLAPILGANPSPYSSIFPTGKRPRGLAIDPTGQYLYTANYDPASNTGSITAFQIDDGTMGGDTGSLIWISDTDTGERTRSVATHPNGGFVYALNERTANIDAFAIDDGSTGGTPGDLISPSTVPGSPFPTSAAANPPNNDDRSYTVTVDSNGNFAFATNFVDGTVDSFVINAADGSLSGRTTVSAGSGPAGITILGVLP
nr:beta-propeller fold lactonase family protein [Deltaproteobacteria bacterium]NIS76541.1 beta-propeller fold lactonase family protein [Deltaproteobacteria bacterium]